MSQIDLYRSNVSKKRAALVTLRKKRAQETARITTHSKKVISAKKTLQNTKSASTIKTKLREIEREEKTLSGLNGAISDLGSKISKLENDILKEEKKLQQAEDREQKKREADEKKRLRESAKQMLNVQASLKSQENTQAKIQEELNELKNIPESITVLFMASNPSDSGRLRLDEEARSINEMIRKSEHRDSVRFETRWATRSEDIFQAINELNPSIVHFSGHGSETEELVLQDKMEQHSSYPRTRSFKL